MAERGVRGKRDAERVGRAGWRPRLRGFNSGGDLTKRVKRGLATEPQRHREEDLPQRHRDTESWVASPIWLKKKMPYPPGDFPITDGRLSATEEETAW